jgi:putative aldouronate transport system permease protein
MDSSEKMIKTPSFNRGIKRSAEDRFISLAVGIIMVVVFIATIYPFWYAIVLSFNDGRDALRGGIYFWPRKWTLDNYNAVFGIDYVYTALLVTVARTLLGTVLSVLFTGLFAYSCSHRRLMFRKFYITAMLFVMYFSGGLVPYYMLLRVLGLMNTFWVYIIPNLFSTFNAIIMMNFFRGIPDSLEEAARLDGANDLTIFFRIIFPVSLPLFATMALYSGVWHWNAWSDAAFFVTNKNLKTLGYVLITLINQTESAAQTVFGQINQAEVTYTSLTLRPAAMVICVVPIVIVYPFLQKHFVKGILLGSIKQ